MMKKVVLLTLGVLWVAASAMGQRSKTVTATGRAVGTDLGTVTQAALYDAKRNALLEAEVPERVQSQGIVFIGTDNTVAREHVAAELDLLMLDGRVRLKHQQCDTSLVNGLLQVKAQIRAEVLLDDGADKEFSLRVSGLRPTYREDEAVSFEIEVSKDCYLRIFWFEPPTSPQSKGGQLYPLERKFRDRLFHADSTYRFPRLPEDCILGNPQRFEFTNDGTAPVEYNVLFVVALKKKKNYDRKDYSYEEFVQWLWSIDPSDRVMQYALVGIMEK